MTRSMPVEARIQAFIGDVHKWSVRLLREICRQQNLGGGGRRSSRSFNVAGEVHIPSRKLDVANALGDSQLSSRTGNRWIAVKRPRCEARTRSHQSHIVIN